MANLHKIVYEYLMYNCILHRTIRYKFLTGTWWFFYAKHWIFQKQIPIFRP